MPDYSPQKAGNMQHYRLLRNNRESGPYSQQDIIDLGLKAYDLIWVEGKSSSWKYPSEVDTLKSYAPPATEDLYALFHTPKFVRQTTNPSITPLVTDSNSTTTLPKITSRRYVSVILPNAAPMQLVPVIGNQGQTPTPIPEQILLHSEELVPDLFSEDSHIAISHTIPYKSKNRYLVAAAFLVLLTTGIYFGTARNSAPVARQDGNLQASGSLVSLTSNATNPNEKDVNNSDPAGLQTNSSLDFAAAKRFVQVKHADFNVGYFGGISGLELAVMNTGKLRLTKIVIAIDFLGNDKTIQHTENIIIPSLEPAKQVLIPVPESPDGIAIQTRVIGVNELSAQ